MTDPRLDGENPRQTRWDAIVVGAGPAGAMAARELAAGGASVLIVEKRAFPREKVCGGCINGHALAVLESAGLGSLVARAGGVPLDGFRVGLGGRSVRLDLSVGMALSRARLDAELVAAAIDAGAHFLARTEAQVGGVDGSTRIVRLGRGGRADTATARVVVLAAGLGGCSLVDGMAPRSRIAPGSAVGAGCRIPEGTPFYREGTIFMAVGDAGYVGLVRLRDGSLNIAGALRPGALQECGSPGAVASRILARAGFPEVEGLESAAWNGTLALSRRTRPLGDTRLFLLGDAAGYVEPFTGEGIAWALASGRAIAPLAMRAMDRWDPRLVPDWQDLHGRLVGRRQFICRATAAVMRRPAAARAAIGLLDRLPAATRFLLRQLNAPPRHLEAS